MANKELKAKNAAELLVSLRKNLNDVSKDLSLKYEEKQLVEKDISLLEKKNLEAKQEFDNLMIKTQKVFVTLDNRHQKLELERQNLNEEKEVHLSKLVEINKQIDVAEGRYENLLIEINELHKTLAQLQDKVKELQGVKLSIIESKKIFAEVDRNINNKKNELDSLNKEIREARERGLKELSSIEDKKQVAEEALERAIRAQDPIKENMAKEKAKFDREKKDFQILVGRLRTHYRKIGQDFAL